MITTWNFPRHFEANFLKKFLDFQEIYFEKMLNFRSLQQTLLMDRAFCASTDANGGGNPRRRYSSEIVNKWPAWIFAKLCRWNQKSPSSIRLNNETMKWNKKCIDNHSPLALTSYKSQIYDYNLQLHNAITQCHSILSFFPTFI